MGSFIAGLGGIVGLVIIGIVVLFILWLIGVYNRFVKLKHRAEEAWSDIDVQLQRRHDLIPNLVETVKGYAAHEQETLQKVIEARNMAMAAQSKGAAASAEAENMLTDTLKSIFALSESYPDLKANENFAKLQDELSDTENKVMAARRFYNDTVKAFNISFETFPANLFAKQLGFAQKEYFEVGGEAVRQNPNVSF